MTGKYSLEKVIVLTGGGTAGHVMPHLAILPRLEKDGWKVFYIGSSGVEKEIIGKSGLKYHEISAGKLRRYFSIENFFDIFKVALGMIQSVVIMKRERPSVVFSKGGFVSVPVAAAAWLLGIPVISHESDLSPGLANRIITRFARSILYSFPGSSKYLESNAVLTGLPIRPNLFEGSRAKGLALAGFSGNRPVILIMGGSLGAQKINEIVHACLPQLLMNYDVVHITGQGKEIEFEAKGYAQFPFLDNIEDVLSMADVVVSRAGANSIFEFLALKKPMLLIPLESGSRGDQLENARCFVEEGWAHLAREGSLTSEGFLLEIEKLFNDDRIKKSQQDASSGQESIDRIVSEIARHAKKDKRF